MVPSRCSALRGADVFLNVSANGRGYPDPVVGDRTGVKPAGVRVSVGYEDLEDIKLDFDRAFKKACE